MRSLQVHADSDLAPYTFRARVPIVLALFATFVVFSAIRSPVPGVNEPHTLTKVKHYWDPSFCRGDFYIESPDVYIVFYSTVGQLTRWFTLEQAAWAGRAIAMLVLAVCFDRLVSRIVPGRWSTLWVGWLYLIIVAIGRSAGSFFGIAIPQVFDFSGEWIVGGVEAKVFAYAFLFAAMGCWIDARRYRAAFLAGLAVSLHPVVGVWGVVAAVFASLVDGIFLRRNVQAAAETGVRSREWMAIAALLLLAAAPGLVPALKFAGSGDPALERKAAFIQTFYRLQHHLDPVPIPWTAYAGYMCLVLVWLLGRLRASLNTGERWFSLFVAGSVLILLAGIALGYRTGPPAEMPYWQIRTRLLRFYPFRLADAMIPIAASMVLVGLARQFLAREADKDAERVSSLQTISITSLLSVLIASMFQPSVDRNPSRLSAQQMADWKDVCAWVAAETPADALFFTPTFNTGFKWYAHRPEFVCYKDCPQDAPGIVEWNNRLRLISDWQAANADSQGRMPANALFALRELSKQFQPRGIEYVVSVDGMLGPFPLDPIYENGTCRVYSLKDP